MSVFRVCVNAEAARGVGDEDELCELLFEGLGVHVWIGFGQLAKGVGVVVAAL